MSSPIVNPEIPFNGNIPGGLQVGKMCRIQGVTHPNTDRFNINLQTGPSPKPRDDTALHISVRLNQGYIARNSYKDGAWGDEEGRGTLPIGIAQAFEILLLIDPNHYKVAINGQHFCEFAHRIPFTDVSHLLIDGDVSITLISWESATEVVGAAASQASQVFAGGPQPSPQQFGPPGYNTPQEQYGPAPVMGYGPPVPPGAQPESGFESFIEQAQSVLAGAIKSGAAEKLLSGLLSSGGQQPQTQGQGYIPQNAQYGIYPQLPQDVSSQPNYNTNFQNTGSGSEQQIKQSQGIDLSSLLSGLLSSGNDQQGKNQYQNSGSTSGTPSTQQHQNQQNVNTDQFRDILANLIAGKGNESQQRPQDVMLDYNTNFQNTRSGSEQQIKQSQGIDLSSLLSGLLSSGNDQQGKNQYQNSGSTSGTPLTQQQQNQYGQNVNTDQFRDILANLIAGKGNESQQDQFHSTTDRCGQVPQQYGQYPVPSQPREQRGPLENLLSGFLSTDSSQAHQPIQHQPQLPQVGGEGSIGGLGSMGGILTNLAGKILHNPRDGNQHPN